jgi:hypothetical protein
VSLPLISSLHKKILPFLKNHLPSLIKNDIPVEIHTRLFEEEGDLLTNDFYKATLQPGLNNEDPDALECQLLFIYLVKHLDRHEKTGDFQLKYYLDLFLLLNKYDKIILDERIVTLSKKYNSENLLIEKLLVLGVYWKADIMNFYPLNNNRANLSKIEAKFESLLRNPESQKNSVEGKKIFKLISGIPGTNNKFLYITGYLFPSLDYLKYKYQIKRSLKAIPYYFIRWFEILRYFSSGKTMYR